MKVRVLYHQGTAPRQEDQIIFCPPCLFAVADGTSSVYVHGEEQKLFGGLTGGQLASRAVLKAFASAASTKSLEKIIERARRELKKNIDSSGLDINDSASLPSASFIAVRIFVDPRTSKSRVEILQAGDCLAVWELASGIRHATPNKVFNYDRGLKAIIADLMKKHNQNRIEMWRKFVPILAERRRDAFNKKQGGFAVLNGQESGFSELCVKNSFPTETLRRLIIFTDGFVPFELTRSPQELSRSVLSLYKKGGLPAVLEKTRDEEKRKLAISHENFSEATAVAIEF